MSFHKISTNSRKGEGVLHPIFTPEEPPRVLDSIASMLVLKAPVKEENCISEEKISDIGRIISKDMKLAMFLEPHATKIVS